MDVLCAPHLTLPFLAIPIDVLAPDPGSLTIFRTDALGHRTDRPSALPDIHDDAHPALDVPSGPIGGDDPEGY